MNHKREEPMTPTKRRLPPGIISAAVSLAFLTVPAVALLTDPEAAPTYQTLTPAQETEVVFFAFTTAEGGTRGPVGSVHELGSGSVPGGFVGSTCTATVQEANNESFNNNALEVRSASTLRFEDVEANTSHTYTGQLQLGSTVSVFVELGPRLDGRNINPVSSISGIVSVSCLAPPDTTPSTTPSTSSTVPPTSSTLPPGTTTSEPPSNNSTTTTPSTPPSTTPVSGSPTTSPASSSTSSQRCPPGSHSMGEGACAANEESG